jgi:hypothetical protein
MGGLLGALRVAKLLCEGGRPCRRFLDALLVEATGHANTRRAGPDRPTDRIEGGISPHPGDVCCLLDLKRAQISGYFCFSACIDCRTVARTVVDVTIAAMLA